MEQPYLLLDDAPRELFQHEPHEPVLPYLLPNDDDDDDDDEPMDVPVPMDVGTIDVGPAPETPPTSLESESPAIEPAVEAAVETGLLADRSIFDIFG